MDKNLDKLASIEDKKPFEVVYAEAKAKGLKQLLCLSIFDHH